MRFLNVGSVLRTNDGEPPRSRAFWFVSVLFGVTLFSLAGCTAKLAPKAEGGAAGDASPETGGNPPETGTNVCASDAGAKSKGKTEACTCDGECQTGFCVDGVCCSSACAESCKACNLPMSLGECAFIPAGVRPTRAFTCSATAQGTCGTDGTCDGKGGCRKYPKGTSCGPGTCEDDAVTGARECDGAGNCSVSAARVMCQPYTCDGETGACSFECTTNVQCAASQQCVNQSCGLSPPGAKCTSNDRCASGFCTDGVCCSSACSGTCVSCNQPGSVGRCTPLGAGQPDPACAAKDASTCGTTGLCDGFGNCSIFPKDTICKPATCSGNVLLNTARTCDGLGTCRDPELIECKPYSCDNAAGACNTGCKDDSFCAPGTACAKDATGKLTCGKKQNGQSCADASECGSGQCVDGVCCESSCTGACRSCDLPGSPGRCLNVATASPDPHNTCQSLGSASCGTNGLCDGSGACQKYPVGTVCAPESCEAGSHSPASTCNASGQCVASNAIACKPYVCNGDTCFNSCSSDIQCTTGSCSRNSCGLKGNGQECGAGGECASGFCAQGVCCNQACAEACKACNLPASLGTCASVADGSPDPQNQCLPSPTELCGRTGSCKGGVCAFVEKGKNCGPAACAGAASVTPPLTCDGQGTCHTPDANTCGGFVCFEGACKSSCVSNADCVPPSTCGNNTCGLKPIGTACIGNSECLTDHCTEGVCCDSACSDDPTAGTCKTCKLAGKLGTCLPIADGLADLKGRCVPSNVSAGDCSTDGTCDGAGACRPWSSATGCGAASCSAGTLTPAVNCDGKGHCTVATPTSCGSYACAATPTCLNACKSDADCVNATCDRNANKDKCGGKLAKGDQCESDSDCDSTPTRPLYCVENVCCDGPCTSACKSCTTTGSVGTCAPITIGNQPRANTTTCAASAAQCGNDGTCDGAGNCKQKNVCDDGNPCTQTDVCQNGVCMGINQKPCPQDACHKAGTCTPATGICTAPAKDDGTQCNDGNPCTRNDVCTSGVCAGASFTCADPDQCHQGGTCNGDGTCSYANKPDGTQCNDGAACTKDDKCTGGICGGTAYTCDPLSCATNACDGNGGCTLKPDTGTCVIAGACYANGDTNPGNQCEVCAPGTSQSTWSPKANGTTCNDGNPLTAGDICTAGTCAGVDHCIGVTCSALDQCHTVGTCDHATGLCSNPNKANETPCDDANPLTTGDVCTSGVCAGVDHCIGVTCTASDQCHLAGTCVNHATGACSNPNAPDSTSCDDGNPNTVGDQCSGGLCAGVDHCIGVTCTASDQCHLAGTCVNHATGTCSNPNAPDGTTCNDGNPDTVGDQCSGGLCAGVDHCIGVTCTASDQCHVAGTCVNHTTGACSNPNAPNGTTCDDGDPNTVGDQCSGGLCGGVDHCIGVTCTASDQCHVAGACVDHATGACSNPNAPDGTTCNDGKPDTVDDQCSGGLCAGVDHCVGVTCIASDQCHLAGTCVDHATGACSNPNAPVDTTCSDEATDPCCQAGVCTCSP